MKNHFYSMSIKKPYQWINEANVLTVTMLVFDRYNY